MAIQSPSHSVVSPVEPGSGALRRRASGPGPRVRYSDTTDYDHRNFINLAATIALLVVMVAMVWTIQAIEAQQKMERCFFSGRRDCLDLNIPQPQRFAIRPPAR